MIRETYGDYRLDSYEPVRLQLPDFEVTDSDIEKEMNRIALRHATTVDAEAHPVKADDLVRIRIETVDDGNIFPGFTSDAIDVQLGVGILPEELELALMGHSVGDTVTATFDYVDNSQVSSEAETPADGGCGVGETGEKEVVLLSSTITILSQRKTIVPKITDEWVRDNIALSNTVDEFRKKTGSRLKKESRRKYANDVEYDVIKELGTRLVGALPEQPVRDLEKRLFKEFDEFLDQYELDRSSYLAIEGLDELSFAEQIIDDAEARVAQDIALAVWANHFDITLSDGDIDFMFGEPTPERTFEARVSAEQSGQIDTFKDLALRAKVAGILTQEAVFVNSDGAEDADFKKIIQEKYRKLEMVKQHATSKPMMEPPLVKIPD